MSSLPNGYFLLYKPKGISSFKAIIQAKDRLAKQSGIAFKKIKIGHAGTLDPLASGLLLCATEGGTKVLSHLLLAEKSYIADIQLGEFSETDDSEGEKFNHLKKRDDTPSQIEVKTILRQFIGSIKQLSPKYSALKIDGKRSCDRIRKGQNVMQKTRTINIFNITLLHYSYPQLKIEVHCGSGTYIRSLARDIGDTLSTGGYIQDLERVSIGRYKLNTAVFPQNITKNDIQPFTKKDIDLQCVKISQEQYQGLFQGKRLKKFTEKENISDGEIGLCLQNGDLVGFGKRIIQYFTLKQ